MPSLMDWGDAVIGAAVRTGEGAAGAAAEVMARVRAATEMPGTRNRLAELTAQHRGGTGLTRQPRMRAFCCWNSASESTPCAFSSPSCLSCSSFPAIGSAAGAGGGACGGC